MDLLPNFIYTEAFISSHSSQQMEDGDIQYGFSDFDHVLLFWKYVYNVVGG